MRNNSVVIDTTHGLIHFLHLTMQVKATSKFSANAKPQVILTNDDLTDSSRTTKTITAFVDHPSECNTTGTVTPLEKFTERANSLMFFSISTILDRKVAVRATSTTETPYWYFIKRNTQIAEFSVVTPEQAKFIKPVDTALLSLIPEIDSDLTAYLKEFFRKNKPEQQSNTF